MCHHSSVVTLRFAVPEDDERLSDLDGLTWSAAVSPAPVPHHSDSFFRKAIPGDVMVVVDTDQILGYVQFRRPTELKSNDHVWEINGLAVDPSNQRMGLGRMLLSSALEEVWRRGGRRVTLRVLSTNEIAQRLYSDCGFTVEGTLRGEFKLDGVDIDDVQMACFAPSE